VEDDESLLHSIGYILENNGYDVSCSRTGEQALEIARGRSFDLAVLDIGLPGIDGIEVANRLAQVSPGRPPRIVMLTGCDVEESVVSTLETVADDYIVKPVRPRILMARLKSVLRRTGSAGAQQRTCITAGTIEIDEERYEARCAGRPLELTRTEFELLALFVAHPGKVLSRRDLIAAVRGIPTAISERSIDFQIHSLRRKLGAAGVSIKNVRGVGFKLVVD